MILFVIVNTYFSKRADWSTSRTFGRSHDERGRRDAVGRFTDRERAERVVAAEVRQVELAAGGSDVDTQRDHLHE